MNATGEFDREALDRIQEMGGTALVHRLLTLVLQQVPGRIEAIQAGVASGDLSGVAFAAHALRSSAGNVGATRVLALATRLEAEARAGNAAAVPPLAADLQPAYATMCQRLSEILEEAA